MNSRPVIFVFDVQVPAQHVGQPANLAPAHGVGLAGDTEGAHARASDAARGKVAVEDGVDFVGAAGGLVHTLGVNRNDAFGLRPEAVELG